MPVWQEGGGFLDNLKADKDVAAALSVSELDALFDLAHHTRHVGTIFRRVFGEG